MSKTLYICYFGLHEPLVQTQVIPYLLELRKDGINVSLLTFEPNLRRNWPKARIEEQRAELSRLGIDWHCLAYHKRFSLPATLYDILFGTYLVWRMNREAKFDIFHGRVHLPTLMGWIARKFSSHKPKLLFDVRGFFPEEYTDAGIWKKNGFIYKGAKFVENLLRRDADGFVVLTEKARDMWFPESRESGFDKNGRPVEVIPCCVDTAKFEVAERLSASKIRDDLGIGERKIVAYVGSFGGWYLTEKILDLFVAARFAGANAFILVLTQRQKEKIHAALKASGIAETDFFVGTVPPNEIGRYLSSADVAVSLIKACYSKLSSSPTKIAEYLACGVPIIANRGVGDVDQLIEENKVGVLLDDFDYRSYERALNAVQKLGDIRARCRSTAKKEFDLSTVGGVRYRRLYGKLLSK